MAMKNRFLAYITIIAMLFGPLFSNQGIAQVFIMEDEETNRIGFSEGDLPSIPLLGENYDQYTPLGGEALLLGCLGGAYLIFKSRKNKE